MDLLLIKHGILQLAIGILAGMPYVKAISKKKNNEEQWRVAHLAGTLGGIVSIALGTSYSYYESTTPWPGLMGFGYIISNWLFTYGLVVAGISGKRGLNPKSKTFAGKSIFIAYTLAAILSSFSTLLVSIGAVRM